MVQTPLHRAVLVCNEGLRMLLGKGADCYATTFAGETSLHLAVSEPWKPAPAAAPRMACKLASHS